jgi:hypothetical protein
MTLSSTVNRVQGHACTKAYFLRINKATKQEECRFLLPDALRDKPKVDQHPTRSYMQFFLGRNDGYLNKYNRLTTMAWQANTDVSLCTSVAAVIEYIVKYAVNRLANKPAKPIWDFSLAGLQFCIGELGWLSLTALK